VVLWCLHLTRLFKGIDLIKYCLLLALSTVVTREASADSCAIVADTTSRAIASLSITITTHYIFIGRAFTFGAVRSTETNVTNAALLLDCIPRCRINLSSFSGKLLCSDANTTIRAVVRACGTFASITLVVIEALAQTSLSVTSALVGALSAFVTTVVCIWDGNPSLTHWAGA